MAGLRATTAAIAIGLLAAAACSPASTNGLHAPLPEITTQPPGAPAPSATTPGPERPIPDVTLAYFRQGLGVVGVSPACCGEQGTAASRLWLTTDGTHWRDVTPPRSGRGRSAGDHPIFEDASFVDARTGWVTTWDPGDLSVAIFRTRDGGATWSRVAGGGHSAAAGATVRVQLISARVAVRETLEPTAPGMDLAVTTDGGAHWRSVYAGPPPRSAGEPLAGPFEMPMTFTSARRGFAADGIPPVEPALAASSGDLFTTSDGGRSWTRLQPPAAGAGARCPASAAAATACVVGLPTFTDAWHGVLTQITRGRSSSILSFDTTADGGTSWRLAGTLTVPKTSVTYPAVSTPSATTWWVLTTTANVAVLRETVDGGGHWSERDGVLLPGRPVRLQALDTRRAWLVVAVRNPRGTARELLHTTDGGRSWVAATP